MIKTVKKFEAKKANHGYKGNSRYHAKSDTAFGRRKLTGC